MKNDLRGRLASLIFGIQKGRAPWPAAFVMWPFLVAAGYIYYLLNYLKYFIYTKGVLKPKRTDIFTLCVGNIKVGGTGKSPMVIKIASELLARGIPVCVINRGYLGPVRGLNVLSDGVRLLKKVHECSDEAYMEALALLGGGVPGSDREAAIGGAGPGFLTLGENRVSSYAGARVVTAKERVDAIDYLEKIGFSGVALLDDAFQYYRLEKDMNIVLLDYSDPFSNFLTFPAGMLRDRPEKLSEASAIVLTKCPPGETAAAGRSGAILRICRRSGFAGPAFVSRTAITGLYDVKKASNRAFSDYRGRRALIVSALADNQGFFTQAGRAARQAGLEYACAGFPDHFAYDDEAQSAIASKMKSLSAGLLITTFKDMVKLKKIHFEGCDVCAVTFETAVDDFGALIDAIVARYGERKNGKK